MGSLDNLLDGEKMRLSKTIKYKEYTIALINKRFDEAELALKSCIDIAKKEKDQETLIYLIELSADLHFQKGNKEKALDCLMEAEAMDRQSPLTKYHLAKFFVDKLRDYKRAIEKCNEVIKIVSINPWPKTNHESSSTHYLAQCYALQGYCYGILKNFREAQKELLLLLDLKDEYVIDYAVKLCELLINNGYCVEQAKDYLNHLVQKLAEDKKSSDYKDLINQINKILQR